VREIKSRDLGDTGRYGEMLAPYLKSVDMRRYQ